MLTNTKKALVIGGTGLLGYGVSQSLLKNGWAVRVFGNAELPKHLCLPGVEYVIGDIWNEKTLTDVLEGVDSVFYFISTTFPKSSAVSLSTEVGLTLKMLDYTLSMMLKCGITSMVFPSSGGTVYGDLQDGYADEEHPLNPATPYGAGKVMCEQMLRYYSTKGINALILRVGNVYGSSMYRAQPQGVIDIFIQNALAGKPLTVWGNAENVVRDYIFLDDFSTAVALAAELRFEGVEVFNIGSGEGVSLKDILEQISANFDGNIVVEHIADAHSGTVSRSVLCVDKLKRRTNWHPWYTLQQGIAETVRRKKESR